MSQSGTPSAVREGLFMHVDSIGYSSILSLSVCLIVSSQSFPDNGLRVRWRKSNQSLFVAPSSVQGNYR